MVFLDASSVLHSEFVFNNDSCYLSIKYNVCCNFYHCHRQSFIVKTSVQLCTTTSGNILQLYRNIDVIRSNDTYRNHIVRAAIMCQQGISRTLCRLLQCSGAYLCNKCCAQRTQNVTIKISQQLAFSQ